MSEEFDGPVAPTRWPIGHPRVEKFVRIVATGDFQDPYRLTNWEENFYRYYLAYVTHHRHRDEMTGLGDKKIDIIGNTVVRLARRHKFQEGRRDQALLAAE